MALASTQQTNEGGRGEKTWRPSALLHTPNWLSIAEPEEKLLKNTRQYYITEQDTLPHSFAQNCPMALHLRAGAKVLAMVWKASCYRLLGTSLTDFLCSLPFSHGGLFDLPSRCHIPASLAFTLAVLTARTHLLPPDKSPVLAAACLSSLVKWLLPGELFFDNLHWHYPLSELPTPFPVVIFSSTSAPSPVLHYGPLLSLTAAELLREESVYVSRV